MSITDMILAAIVVGARRVGTYLMLPHKHGLARPRAVHGAGAVAAGLGAAGVPGVLEPAGPVPGRPCSSMSSALMAIVGGLLTVTSRNPVYSALWFASVVLSTSGLFLLAGCAVPRRRDDHRLCRRDHRHVPVRDHAGPDGRQGRLRPGGPSPGWATFTCFLLLWCLIVLRRDGPHRARRRPRASAGGCTPRRTCVRSRDRVAYEARTDSPIIDGHRRGAAPTSQISEPPSPTADRRRHGRSIRSRPGSPSRTSPAWAPRSTPTTW